MVHASCQPFFTLPPNVHASTPPPPLQKVWPRARSLHTSFFLAMCLGNCCLLSTNDYKLVAEWIKVNEVLCVWKYYEFPGWYIKVCCFGKRSQLGESGAFQSIRFQLACSGFSIGLQRFRRGQDCSCFLLLEKMPPDSPLLSLLFIILVHLEMGRKWTIVSMRWDNKM